MGHTQGEKKKQQKNHQQQQHTISTGRYRDCENSWWHAASHISLALFSLSVYLFALLFLTTISTDSKIYMQQTEAL